MKFRVQPRSIAFRLIVAVLAVELLSAVLVAALSFGYERHIHFRAFDVMLRGRADSVLGAVQDANDAADNVMLDQADLRLPPEDVYEVRDGEGHLLGRSSNWQGAGNWPAADGRITPEPTRDGRDERNGRDEHEGGRGEKGGPPGDISRMTINGRHYRVLRMEGTRTVDPGEQGGGKVRRVTIVYGSPTSRVWHEVESAVEFYAAGSLVLLLVTGPLIAWLLQRGLLPLRQLAALASQVSVDSWEFAPPASARTTPELAPLTHALESALQRLERSFLQQRAFVSDAAHELKTAVAVVKSSIQLLNMKPRSATEYKAGLERCLADSQRLEALVADMLALARAESAALDEAAPVATNVSDCVQQVVAQLETVAALRNVGVLVPALAPSAVSIPVAQEDCRLLVSNLLLNALQHSPPQATVEVSLTVEAQADKSTAVLVIQDHGDGISAEALPHVFDRFYRGDPSRTRNTGGTGLGLAIARAIVTRAGGTISIASVADASAADHGATVTVRIPTAD